jgi:hypothetical protein
VATPSAVGTEVFLKMLDGVRQHRKHKSFFRREMVLLAKHVKVLKGRQNVGFDSRI